MSVSVSHKKNALFLFHRDLRIDDNVGLVQALRQYDAVYTAFIFTPEQVSRANPYKSTNSIQFMIESLEELAQDIAHRGGGQLIFLYGNTVKLLVSLFQELKIDALFFNRDYTPYARKRDASIMELCQRAGIKCFTYADYYLQEPGTVLNGSGEMYHKFTSFYTDMLSRPVLKPAVMTPSMLTHFAKPRSSKITGAFELDITMFVKKPNPDLLVHGGRAAAKKRLQLAVRTLAAHFDQSRNHMEKETTLLSAYLKYGCISIREAFYAFAKNHGLKNNGIIRELIWRDFFAHLLYMFPDTLHQSYYRQYDRILWSASRGLLEDWKHGETGFPLVDACMRQLNTTGYMHNRGRMVVASFLMKTLLIDWREGERYFAQQLVDYDVASNRGNWASILGGGAYSMPWFRVMNPWIQSAKYDKDAVYVKRWVPELADVDARDIHRWSSACHLEKYKAVRYPEPVVDYTEQKAKYMKMMHAVM